MNNSVLKWCGRVLRTGVSRSERKYLPKDNNNNNNKNCKTEQTYSFVRHILGV